MKKSFTVLVVAIATMIAGCASIVSKSNYPVTVNSAPDGASFTIKNAAGSTVASGTTPEVVTLKSGNGYFKTASYQIVVSKDGFADQTHTLSSSLDGWYWGNIVLGGLIGILIVDPITGAMYRLPDRVDIDLDESAASADGSVDVVFASLDSLTDEQRSRLVRVE